LQGLGIAQLEEQILQTIGRGNFQRADQTYAINQRQQACLIKAVTALSQMQNTITAQLPLDFWTIDLRSAIHALGEITGAEISESLLDQIFSRFCIGK
jgi:tRNA modification GTPase